MPVTYAHVLNQTKNRNVIFKFTDLVTDQAFVTAPCLIPETDSEGVLIPGMVGGLALVPGIQATDLVPEILPDNLVPTLQAPITGDSSPLVPGVTADRILPEGCE